MIESTFQLAAGVGPGREHDLWRKGIGCWDDFLGDTSGAALGLSVRTHAALRAAIDVARDALSCRDADRLAALLPSGERWRMFPEFGEDAAYLDIETGDDDVAFAGISAIGVFDRRGPRLFLAGRDLHVFPEVARGYSMLVTFNGLSFDVPILMIAFPDWRPPVCHVDLRHLLARLGHGGGLKAIERALVDLRLSRPVHLAGIDGRKAAWLWRRGREGDAAALRLFAEYNLYDVVNLRTLIAYAYGLLVDTIDVAAVRARAPRVTVPARGDVLYDVSKILLAL